MSNNSSSNTNSNDQLFSRYFNLPTFFVNGDALANAYFNYERLESISNWLKSKTTIKPLIGIVCGSGLGSIADLVQDKIVIPYNEIPDFPRVTVEGHEGNLLFGYLNGMPVVCMQGRFHPYEGYVMAVCTMPIKVFKFLGVKLMILTNAAGGINKSYRVGDLMVIKDHLSYPMLNLHHPLVGPNDSRLGPRFLPINKIYSKDLRDLLKQVSEESSIQLHEGIYGTIGGPTYETVSDIKVFQTGGADVVGMSTSHEAIVAAYCGMKVLGLSIVTDMTVDVFDAIEESNHEEICKVAQAKTKDVEKLVVEFIGKIHQNLTLLD